jgi:cell division protease FtsH
MIHDRTLKILQDNYAGFSELAELLLEKEVIFADDLERIFGPRAGAKAETVASPEVETVEIPDDQQKD